MGPYCGRTERRVTKIACVCSLINHLIPREEDKRLTFSLLKNYKDDNQCCACVWCLMSTTLSPNFIWLSQKGQVISNSGRVNRKNLWYGSTQANGQFVTCWFRPYLCHQAKEKVHQAFCLLRLRLGRALAFLHASLIFRRRLSL